MPFIAPMLATRLMDPALLRDPRLIAEPKLDGQRAQVHIRDGRAVHVYSRFGSDLLRHAGIAWLRDLAWPVREAVLDGEACAGDGHAGIQAVFEARCRADGAMSFAAFDVLALDGLNVMGEAWRDRRKRLEDLLDGRRLPRVGLVPVADDAPKLYETWLAMGGEGIVLKEPASIYRPGVRSTAWLTLKPKITLDVLVTGGSPEPVRWGDCGRAVELHLRYRHPREGTTVEIKQAVRLERDGAFDLNIGGRAEILSWGVMPSGMLRHPVFVRWLDRIESRTT